MLDQIPSDWSHNCLFVTRVMARIIITIRLNIISISFNIITISLNIIITISLNIVMISFNIIMISLNIITIKPEALISTSAE